MRSIKNSLDSPRRKPKTAIRQEGKGRSLDFYLAELLIKKLFNSWTTSSEVLFNLQVMNGEA